MNTNCEDWIGCFEGNWKGLITPKAFQHPAKWSHSLLVRCIQHAKANLWVKDGDVVVDPFGGVGCGGVMCAFRGLQWVGIELEKKFFDLANENFDLHRRNWEASRKPIPNMIHGNSKDIFKLFKQANLIVSSPPYADVIKGGQTEKEPISVSKKKIKIGGYLGASQRYEGYGLTDGNLSKLVTGDLRLVLSSPPYWETGVATAKGGQQIDPERLLTSLRLKRKGLRGQGLALTPQGKYTSQYGKTEGQLAAFKGETFWEAAKVIVSECVKVLKPGGHAIWNCKDFVRNKERINFSEQWQSLCESCGLKTVCVHRALLVKTSHVQTFFGTKVKEKKHVSFFRRLHEKKGAPKIDWEDVICMVKP